MLKDFKPFIEMVNLPLEVIERAKAFAHACIDTVNYSDSNQTIRGKVISDIMIGKMGEEAAKIALEKNGHEVTGPDYRVYEGKNKSWAPDLYASDVGIAVKSQGITSARRYGLSWCFAHGSRKDPILEDPDAWVIFTLINGFSALVFSPKQVKNLTFSEPVLKHLAGSKRIVYYEEM